MAYEYQLVNEQYVLMCDGTPYLPPMAEVAIAFDRQTGLLKHGAPHDVDAWCLQAQAKLREAGFPEFAEDLMVIKGRFELDELNRCLDIFDYVLRLSPSWKAAEV